MSVTDRKIAIAYIAILHSDAREMSNFFVFPLNVDRYGTLQRVANKKFSYRRQATQLCLAVVSFDNTILERSLLLLVTSASDLHTHTTLFTF